MSIVALLFFPKSSYFAWLSRRKSSSWQLMVSRHAQRWISNVLDVFALAKIEWKSWKESPKRLIDHWTNYCLSILILITSHPVEYASHAIDHHSHRFRNTIHGKFTWTTEIFHTYQIDYWSPMEKRWCSPVWSFGKHLEWNFFMLNEHFFLSIRHQAKVSIKLWNISDIHACSQDMMWILDIVCTVLMPIW